ncbi:MAG: hypothetical protein M0T70_07010 [Geobacteraceae bacterium]|nr:hypothetical protein [Geobacteraceae bacterium]
MKRYPFKRVVSVMVLFVITAVAEIAGCYLPWLWFNNWAPVRS